MNFDTPYPTRLEDIKKVLKEDYELIMGKCKMHSEKLKNIPIQYFDMNEITSGKESTEKKENLRYLNWASWELSRSELDESIKESVGLILFCNMMTSSMLQ